MSILRDGRHSGGRADIRPVRGGSGKSAALLIGCLLFVPATQQFQIDQTTLVRIRAEAIDHSQAGDYLFYLADLYGPRMTGSPNYRAAGDWAAGTLRSLGLQDVHEEPIGEISFAENLKWSGRGWSFSRCSVRMIRPQQIQLLAVPAGWSHGTSGKLVADIVVAPFPAGPDQVDQYIKTYRGRLKGKFALITNRRPMRRLIQPEFSRYNDEELARLALPSEPGGSRPG